MSVWFEGDNEIDCTLQQVRDAFENHGKHYAGVTELMPGLTSVELVDQSVDSVTIRTNEGIMKRRNITKHLETERVVVEFDEVYEAGSKVTVTSHTFDEFMPSDSGVTHRLVVSDVAAPGFLGFFYRTFGASKMGNASLKAHKTYFEQLQRTR